MKYQRCILALSLAAASISNAAVRQSDDKTDVGVVGEGTVTRSSVTGFPDLPTVRVATIPQFDDEPAYVSAITAQAQELTAEAEGTDDPARRTALQLAEANLLLARKLEVPCTRRLLEVPSAGDLEDVLRCREVLQRADELLEATEVALQALKNGQDSGELKGWVAKSQRRLDVLRAFAAALRAYLVPLEGEPGLEGMRRAASLMAPLLEDRDAKTAAAANLWYTCLRRQLGDRVRTLSTLQPALADPVHEALPYAFFGRLLRCRLIAERGGYPTALALLMQIEERCNEWFEDERDRSAAIRAARYVRLQLMDRWYDALGDDDHAAERQWCVDRATDLVTESFSAEDRAVLRLTPAIPIVATPPKPVPENDASDAGGS